MKRNVVVKFSVNKEEWLCTKVDLSGPKDHP